jgi:hypothetical protein
MTAIERGVQITVVKEIDGLEMGVLSDGRPFLTGRTLARLCGVVASAVINQAANWVSGKRDGRLAQLLTEAGIEQLYEVVDFPGSPEGVAYAYTEDVCMIFLEYYAMDAREPTEQARRAHRMLARAGLRAYVYSTLGYAPERVVPGAWRHFHDRVTLHSAPIGYFSVFRESADLVIGAIRGGLTVDDHTVPDISIGKAWSAYWEKAGLEKHHGPRTRHDHNYPDYFPQAASNPQEIWVYPVSALGEFRIWMQRDYVPKNFKSYLGGKVAKGVLAASTAELLVLNALSPEPKLVG